MTTTTTTPAREAAWLPRWVWWSFIGALALYAVPPVVLLFTFRQPAFDLGIYDQSLWLIRNGESFNTVGGMHVLGAHFSPVLWLLAPLSLIPGGAVPELLFEATIVAFTVFPVYRLLIRLGSSHTRLLLLVLLLHPGVYTAVWDGFHPWTLAAPYVAWSALAVLRHPHWWTVAALGCIGLALREDIGFWVGLVTLSLAIGGHVRVRDLAIGGLLVAAASGAVVFGILASLSPTNDYLFRASLGATQQSVGIPASLLVLLVIQRLAYLVIPLGLTFPSYKKVNWLAASPLAVGLVGVTLLGSNALLTVSHYEIHFVLVLIVVLGMSEQIEVTRIRILFGALFAAVTMGVLRPVTPIIGPNPFAINASQVQTFGRVAATLDTVPRNSSLSLPTGLVPHFSERSRVFEYPWPFDEPRDQPFPMECPDPDWVVASVDPPDDFIGWIEARRRYTLVETHGGLGVYRSSVPREETSCGPG